MASVALISGMPGQGKSFLAGKLAAAGFEPVSVDHEYVQFVRTECPQIYFDNLNRHTFLHFLILQNDSPSNQERWRDHLLAVIREKTRMHPRVAIEGWLLGHYEDFTLELRDEGHHVYEIEAHQPRYRLEGQMLTADQVVASLHERTSA
jgi:hypothetical protein